MWNSNWSMYAVQEIVPQYNIHDDVDHNDERTITTMTSTSTSSTGSTVVKAAVAPAPPALPRGFTVPYVILKDTDGRDKVLKTFQYLCRWLKWLSSAYPQHARACAQILLSARTILVPSSLFASSSTSLVAASATVASVARTAAVASDPASRLVADFRSFVDGVIPTIGASRRVIRIFKWGYTVPILHRNYHKWRWEIARLSEAREPNASAAAIATGASITRFPVPGFDWLPLISTIEVFNNVLAEFTDMADDVSWYATFRFMPKGWAPTAARAVILLWFATVLVDLGLTGRQLKIAVTQWRADLRKLMLARSTYDQMVIDASVGKRRDSAVASTRTSTSTETETATSSSPLSSSASSADATERRIAELSQEVESAQLAVDKSQEVAWGHFLNMIKFIGDFGVAFPSALEVQNKYDGTVQFSGFLSAFAATIKLIPPPPPAPKKS